MFKSMRCSKDAFKSFIDNHAHTFPYSEVKKTRTSFRTDWILLHSYCRTSVRFQPEMDFAIPSSCMDNDTLQCSIVTGNSVPMPPDYCEVMDCMHWWGRAISPVWYHEVMGLFADYLCPRGLVFPGPTKQELFYDCVLLWVGIKLTNNMAKEEIIMEWQAYFDYLFMTTTSFFELATESFWFIEYMLNSSVAHSNTPNGNTTQTAVELVPDETESM